MHSYRKAAYLRGRIWTAGELAVEVLLWGVAMDRSGS
jgi:hypothetical protein